MHVHGIKEEADHMHEKEKKEPSIHASHKGCPGSMAHEIKKPSPHPQEKTVSASSQLSQWPIQLRLISPYAPYFDQSDLLIAADCTAYALGSFHQDLLKGEKLIIACPKLDDTSGYIEKLIELLKNNTIHSLTVATMVVPCCRSLVHIVERAVDLSGKKIDLKKFVIEIDGGMHTEKPSEEHKIHTRPLPS